MTTEADIGYGSKYEIYISGAFVQMGEVFEIVPADEQDEEVDATHMQSPGRRRETIPGLIESGEATFSVNWKPGNATDVHLRTLKANRTVSEHRITFPNGVNVTFDARVRGLGRAIPIDDKMSMAVTVVVKGDETWGNEAVPTNLVKPSIVGASVQVGVTLTAIEGEYEGAPDSYAYQWQHDASGNGTFANVSVGGTSETYVPVVGDIADFLRVGVTPTNGAGAGATVYSLPVGPIIAA